MKVIHRGFDKLELSIEATIPPELFEHLNREKELAEDEGKPRPITYGGVDLDLQPHGIPGYRFQLSGGHMDMIWFFKKPNARDPWGVRISVGALMLATQGLGYVRDRINKTLERLGIRFGPHQVSISRADFCVDFLAPSFELDPENFVIHSHSNRADYLVPEETTRSNGKSGQFTSVTVGKMPGRQATIYDKRRQVIETKKPIWWEIWNANLRAKGLPVLDSSDKENSRVWRVEMRAGKRLLKDRWNIRTWEQFDALFGDVIAEAFEKIRYCLPVANDTNRARWPNQEIWELALSEVSGDLIEMRSYVEPSKIKYVHKQEHIRIIMALLTGNAITLAALEGIESEDLQNHADKLADRLRHSFQADPERAANKLGEAKGRYRFVS